ncbi:N-acetyltransferase [Puteibacter caeruleilacunae]|nr:N-acetyltransferase [Puteibacter caeruleilacunae]
MMITESKKQEIQELHLQAFGKEEGPLIHGLVGDMLAEQETISINIEKEDKIVGNVLFTPFKLNEHPDKKCYLLAPIAVSPELHGKGLGKDLIEKGVKHLISLDVDAIFVLGYPQYYGRRGFYPTYVVLPYQTEVMRIDAWKMRELKPGSMAEVGGTSVACNAIMKPEFWDLNYEPGA